MLYDPKWEKPAQLSLDGFIAWLETQPANQQYDFGNPNVCVLASYLGGFCGGEKEFAIIGNQQEIISGRPRTFGAALCRAREFLASQ